MAWLVYHKMCVIQAIKTTLLISNLTESKILYLAATGAQLHTSGKCGFTFPLRRGRLDHKSAFRRDQSCRHLHLVTAGAPWRPLSEQLCDTWWLVREPDICTTESSYASTRLADRLVVCLMSREQTTAQWCHSTTVLLIYSPTLVLYAPI